MAVTLLLVAGAASRTSAALDNSTETAPEPTAQSGPQGVVPNDANIRYIAESGADASLLTCRDWGTNGCADASPRGRLASGQDSRGQFGWSDTDGYYHPSDNCRSEARWGPFVLVIHKAGWVKLSGLYGGTWEVTVTCQGAHA